MPKTITRKLYYLSLVFCHIIAPAGTAAAQASQVVTGRIQTINLSYDSNYAFRIFIADNGVNPASTCAGGFLFLNNIVGENYQAKVSSLLMAYSQGKSVSLNYTLQSDGFCKITDFLF